jgi:hypothetical protein
MGRKLKSPTRVISNRGDHPRFVGYFPCRKSDAPYLIFDSLSSLYVGIFIEWLRRVVKMSFEPTRYVLRATSDGETYEVIPDYGATTALGEIEIFEAKYGDSSQEELAHYKKVRRDFAQTGFRYQVITRKTLERNGFIQTVCFLRRYGGIEFSATVLTEAQRRLAPFQPATLKAYRRIANEQWVRTSVLYHLLYHRHLSLRYEQLAYEELELCRG